MHILLSYAKFSFLATNSNDECFIITNLRHNNIIFARQWQLTQSIKGNCFSSWKRKTTYSKPNTGKLLRNIISLLCSISPYLPEFGPNKYYLFDRCKSIDGGYFSNENHSQQFIEDLFRLKSVEFYLKCIEMLPDNYQQITMKYIFELQM